MRSSVRAQARHLGMRATSALRAYPDFLLIGAQKAGTTSLFAALGELPNVALPSRKEVHFFDLNWTHGLGWYRSHFPMKRPGRITGEATPRYLFDPRVPARVEAAQRTLPSWRPQVIVLLRDPTDRAISQYFHEVNAGRIAAPIAEALDPESIELAAPLDPVRSIIERGHYAEQLERWAAFNPLVLFYEEVFGDHLRDGMEGLLSRLGCAGGVFRCLGSMLAIVGASLLG